LWVPFQVLKKNTAPLYKLQNVPRLTNQYLAHGFQDAEADGFGLSSIRMGRMDKLIMKQNRNQFPG
jgi:hypothetical protein